jgi:mono/diheme cytochrome c family protein
MRQALIATVLAAAGLWPAITIFASEPPPAGDTARGQRLYEEYCRRCHGDDRAGLATFQASQEELKLRLEGQLRENMPDFFGVFREEEIADLHAYLTAR